jgi:proteasome lid subunit RPN8/RPN11
MTLKINKTTLKEINTHLEGTYPEEGAGFLLGSAGADDLRDVTAILAIENSREDGARHDRFLLTAQDMLNAEIKAEDLGLDILGVFHSHPDCPNVPSEFDREWALPWYSYTITRVDEGKAVSTRSWRLNDDRADYFEEKIEIAK